ncbi:isocitrate lyase/phosphoenolpyruvate mutase family protein [Mesorhizobium sp.]|uniref:isocitrate lyase/phosphoenolpyruvate mutase family protein n=1 Tax=Mesorhizobium sp. TaxID=1871066 RepID=UPI00257D9D9D|nr:isocitrate lyase/phosphoenolpyruvate mutase family protein [Mesorhizobium sp.]
MSKAKQLRDRMTECGLVHIMAAHSPLSAVLAEEPGFDGLWASGFELSALYGLPDMSLISMTQHLDMLRAIAGRSSLPTSTPGMAMRSTSSMPSPNRCHAADTRCQ